MIKYITNKFILGKLNHAWLTQSLSEVQQLDPRWTFDDLKKLRQLFKVTLDYKDVLLNPSEHPEVSNTCKRKLQHLQEKGLIK